MEEGHITLVIPIQRKDAHSALRICHAWEVRQCFLSLDFGEFQQLLIILWNALIAMLACKIFLVENLL